MNRKRNRDEYGEAVVEGVRSVHSLIKSAWDVIDVIVSTDFEMEKYPWLDEYGDVQIISRKDFERVSNVRNGQGIMAIVPAAYAELSSITGRDFVVALDGVSDPGNVGTIIRAAAWFGFQTVICGQGTADPYNPKSIRASMGGLWDVNVTRPVVLSDAIGDIKRHGMMIVAADMSGRSLEDWVPEAPGVLVVGSEAHGISSDVQRHIEERITISKRADRRVVESLNAATASSIIMERWSAAVGRLGQ